MPPITTVCDADLIGETPVNLPFTNPNTNNATSVTATEYHNAALAECSSRYGNSGIMPPATYDAAIVEALASRYGAVLRA